jgi:hypothetical protein
MTSFKPPFTPLVELTDTLIHRGFALLQNRDFFSFTQTDATQWEELKKGWESLDPDQYLKDGGKYRQRKHASVIVSDEKIELVPYRPHFQPVSYNALHGGMQRWFTECSTDFIKSLPLKNLLCSLTKLFDQIEASQSNQAVNKPLSWFTEVHQFRIDTASGIGRPTPEGAHRDGVHFVAVLLVDRHFVKGGESRVFSATGPQGERFTLDESWTLLILDDLKVLHETTPIQPMDRLHPELTWRDTLVLTFRKDAFLDDLSSALTTQSTFPEPSSC